MIRNPIMIAMVLALAASLTLGHGLASTYEPRVQDPLSAQVLMPADEYLGTPADCGLSYEPVRFPSLSGSQLTGWLLDRPGTDRVVMICMGNTGNMSYMVEHARLLSDAAFDVFLFDYQGFGKSGGVASVSSLLPDALSAFDYLVDVQKRAPAEIGVLGISLGSVLALAVGANRQPGAVAVEDVFLPSKHVARLKKSMTDRISRMVIAGVERLVLPKVDPLVTAAKMKCPLFLLHGEYDWLLPPGASIEVSAIRTAPTRVWFMEDCGHSPDSLQIDNREFAAQLRSFFEGALSGQPLSDPKVTFQVTAGEPAETSTVEFVVMSGKRRPVEVALTDGRQFEFVRVWSADGEVRGSVALGFVPTHAFAVSHCHVIEAGDSWQSDLSAVSRSRKSLAEFARFTAPATPKLKRIDREGSMHFVLEFDGARWPEAREYLQGLREIDPWIEPEFAKSLANLALGLEPANEAVEAEIAEAVLARIPSDPARYFAVGNATISVGFYSTIVAEVVYRHAKRRLVAGDVPATKTLLGVYLSILPKGASAYVKRPDIDAVTTRTVLP